MDNFFETPHPQLALLRELRSMGLTRATFHEDGSLQSVEFVPPIPVQLNDADTDPAPAPDAPIPRAFRELMKGNEP